MIKTGGGGGGGGGGFYPAPIREIYKVVKKPLIRWKKAGLQKSNFCFDHVNRLIVNLIAFLINRNLIRAMLTF